MKKLAVCSRRIGVPSETFIRRHMVDLLPDNSVVIAESDRPPYGGKWQITNPVLLLKHQNNTIAARAVNMLLRKFSFRKGSDRDHAVRQFLTAHKADVILGEYLDYTLQYLPVARNLNIPLFAHAHGYDVSVRLREDFWRREYRKLNDAAGIITMSEYSKKKLLTLGLKDEKIHIIPYGITVPALPGTAEDSPTVRLLAVGRMVAKKSPVLLLDTFRRAVETNPSMHLDYVGAGPLFASARDYVRALKLEEKVTLHGALDNVSVLKLMSEAHVFVQHSVTCAETGDEEGLPVSILEAMAYGLPVVSTIHAGIPEAVANQETGLLVNEGDTISMAANIVELARQPTLRTRMGAAGRRKVEREFTWEKERNALRALLNL